MLHVDLYELPEALLPYPVSLLYAARTVLVVTVATARGSMQLMIVTARLRANLADAD